MADTYRHFELVVRGAAKLSQPAQERGPEHPFDTRDIHPSMPRKVRELFDDTHYSEATFAACKYLEAEVQRLSASGLSGEKLMMAVFNETGGPLKLTALASPTEIDEQRGYRFLFAGLSIAIRNPRGHGPLITDSIDTCLEHLSFVSHLMRRVERAGFAFQ
jgi:uncharacterized protein (TIGR02391 family)